MQKKTPNRYSGGVCHTPDPALQYTAVRWHLVGIWAPVYHQIPSYFQIGTSSFHFTAKQSKGHSCSWGFSNITTALNGEFTVLNVSYVLCYGIPYYMHLTFQSLGLFITWCTNSLTFNNCTLCPHCIYVFCIYLRTNSDLCHLQHKLIGFYNRDEKCLQRGTDWVFK